VQRNGTSLVFSGVLDRAAVTALWPSLTALEQMLSQYTGTLMIVSHDHALLESVQLTHRLKATESGWHLV